MSWPKLLVAYILGISIGIHKNQEYSLLMVGLGFLFTIFLLLYIVFLNDYADREIDALKRKLFPKESLKTIPDAILPAQHLLRAGLVFFVLGIIVNVIIGIIISSWISFVIGLCCFVFFFIYSFPPIRLNYRGGGEILEGFGVGLVLPFYNYYILTLDFTDTLYLPVVVFYILLSLSSALASGLSDEASDRQGGKITFVTVFGNSYARMGIFILVGFAILVLAFLPFFYNLFQNWVIGLVLLFLLYNLNRMNRVSPRAITNAFIEQKLFKKYLHNAIWGSILILSVHLIFL
ncbi:MAG: prenyltransferase [Leptospira sp.]|nr:prenyltransferase [Leptospira sp.]